MGPEDAARLYSTLRRLSRQMHRFSHKVEHEQEHFSRQAALLRLIAQNDGIVQRDLAEIMDMRPSSMTEALTKMEQQDLIVRRQDQKDQRLMHVWLTDAGKKTAAQAVKPEEDFTNALFQDLTDAEMEQMLAITAKLCDSLDALNSDEPEEFEEEHHGHPHPCDKRHWHHPPFE